MVKLINFFLFFMFFTLILHFVGIIDLGKIFKNIKSSNSFKNSELSRDLKARKVDAFFASINAPVTGHGMEFVLASERYGIDWRVLPAICRQESCGGKYPYNGDSENVLGYRISRNIISINEAVNLSAKSISGQGRFTHFLYKGRDLRGRLFVYSGGEEGYSNKIFSFMNEINNDGIPIN